MKITLPISIFIPLLFLSPYFSAAQTAPNLGTAAKKFVLFTSTGALTNTNTPVRSQITGDVGTNSAAAVSGFVNADGVLRPGADALTTSQAETDISNVITQINAAVSTGAPGSSLGAPGAGQTLTAGVYDINALTTISNNLFLDGQNNPNAVFIFRINGQLVSTTNAKVRMINSAQACNVFWRINASSINLAAQTFMSGNLITNSGAISFASKDTLQGRAFAKTAGAITTDGIFAYMPTGCGEPLPTGPARPVIGITASAYTLFTTSGNITNSPSIIPTPTMVTGDIGTNNGTVAGFGPPAVVNGTVRSATPGSPNASTAACAADISNLYTNLSNIQPDITLNTPSEFGLDLILTPHTYLLNGATSLTDSVFLNSQGLTNAVFVMQINGALTAASLSRVKLINGTQAKNVFWVVKNNAVIWGVNAKFNGNLVCAGAITLGNGDSVTGKLFTTGGAVTTDASIIISDLTVVVPVTWLYFRGTPVKNNVLLEWGTANETNNKFYTIEKSRDGISFEPLTAVNSMTGSGNLKYSFTDNLPYSLGYYRISQTDLDGRRSYYTTVKVRIDGTDGPAVTNYVQGNAIYTKILGTTSGSGTLTVYNIAGRKISSQNIMLNKDGNIYKTEKPLQKGVYFIKIVTGRETFNTGKVTVL